jgi:carbonic anhydrase
MRERFGVEYVDSITEPGPNKILAENSPPDLVLSILRRVEISVRKHGSKIIAVTGHHDCAGNPASEDEQINQIKKSVLLLKEKFPETEVHGLWINENWEVEEMKC